MGGCIRSWRPAAGRIRPRTAGSSFRRPQARDWFAGHQLNLQRPAATDHIDRAVAQNLACGGSLFIRRVEAPTGELIPRIERIRMIGAATLDLAFVAEGALDARVMMSNKPWDTAAGTLVAREAGPHVTDAEGNPHTHQSAATIAATAAIADQLAAVIKRPTLGP
jgi:fructose-1,6-bisphosphatase/inositol monophosphatase family enzyme